MAEKDRLKSIFYEDKTMNTKSKEALFDEFLFHMGQHDPAGGSDTDPSSWCVGITSDVERRVYGEHSAPRDGTTLTRRAASSADARWVEKELLDLGSDGAPGGGDDDAVYVYAFIKP